MTLEAYFIHVRIEDWPPHILGQTPIAYECDGSQGYITFNGSYYVENHPPPYPEDEALPKWERPRRYTTYLPQTHFLFIKIRDPTDGSGTALNTIYMIEVYKKVIHECTDQYGMADLGDGELTRVCFTPTNRQTLYFKVLEVIQSNEHLRELIETKN
jgi:hypothetical protein